MKTICLGLVVAWVGLMTGRGVDAVVSPEQRLTDLGLVLKAPPASVANFIPAVRTGNLVFLSGQIPRGTDGKVIVGKVGREVTTEQAAVAARACGLQLLSALKAEIGSLGKVKRIVRVGGFVNCVPEYTEQPKAINGCSDLLVAVFGDRGRHARAAVGVVALPAGAAVEVDMIVEVTD